MTSVEIGILVWLVVGAGIAAGVFVLARSAVQLGSIAYRVMEKEMSRSTATRQSALLGAAMLAALTATALIAGYAIYAMFALIFESGGGIGILNGGS